MWSQSFFHHCTFEKLNKTMDYIKNGESVYQNVLKYQKKTLKKRIKRKTDSSVQWAGRKQLVHQAIEQDIADKL